MARTERSIDNMIGQFGDKWFMIFWYAELVGWMVRGKKSIEKAMISAFTYETNIADLHGTIQPRWTRFPQGMTVCRVLDCELSTKDVVVGHWQRRKSRDMISIAAVKKSINIVRGLAIQGSQMTRDTPRTNVRNSHIQGRSQYAPMPYFGAQRVSQSIHIALVQLSDSQWQDATTQINNTIQLKTCST